MLLKELLNNIDTRFSEIKICGITDDSRKVKEGYAYVCIVGSVSDGHNYAESAVKNGALFNAPFFLSLSPQALRFRGRGRRSPALQGSGSR